MFFCAPIFNKELIYLFRPFWVNNRSNRYIRINFRQSSYKIREHFTKRQKNNPIIFSPIIIFPKIN
ncbi:Uncharacterised protein [Segatella copri]|nr:Uncharacterised protein [Segatella copri]